MFRAPAKSAQFLYYYCSCNRKSGKRVCAAGKPVNKERIERFVIDRVKDSMLTD
jgi:hypothetical protein